MLDYDYTPKIYYVGNGAENKVPFHKFLNQERERVDLSWEEIEELCEVKGIRAYVYSTSSGHPNSPPQEKFIKIITALGYAEKDFEASSLLPIRLEETYTLEEYRELLKCVGNFILKENEDNGPNFRGFSSTIIRAVAGEIFYTIYGKTKNGREKLYQELLAMDKKYKNIRLIEQKQERNTNYPLNQSEDFSEQEVIRSLVEQYGTERLTEIHNLLNRRLQEKGFKERSRGSLVYHIEKFTKGRKEILLTNRSKAFSDKKEELITLEEAVDRGEDLFGLVSRVTKGEITATKEKDRYYVKL